VGWRKTVCCQVCDDAEILEFIKNIRDGSISRRHTKLIPRNFHIPVDRYEGPQTAGKLRGHTCDLTDDSLNIRTEAMQDEDGACQKEALSTGSVPLSLAANPGHRR